MNSLLPHNATPQEIALELTTARIGGVDVPTKAIWNPETCPADVLPWLAWAFSVDQWDAAWTIEQKRAIVAASINVHKRKGTPGAVKAAVGAIFTGANVVEPWDDASLTAHQFKIVTTDTLRSDADFAELIRLVDAAKPVRSWLVAVQFQRASTRRLYFGTGHHVGAKTRVDLSLPLGADEATIYQGTGMLVATKTIVNTEEPSFSVAGFEPEFVASFAKTSPLIGRFNYYRANGVEVDFLRAFNFARTSGATYVDATGTIQTAAANVPRVGHHVWDGSAWVNEGLLLESEARTNFLRNSTMQGASDGVLSGAGSLPTNWAILGMAASDVTITTGSQYGLNYIDVRYSGTPTSAPALRFEAPAQISAVQGDVLTSSVWLNFVAGSSANLSDFRLQHIEFSSSGYVGLTQGVGIDLPTSFERYSFTGTVSQATTASVYPQMVLPWTSGAIDITLRIYGPQMELAPTPSSYIPTSGATATRAAETLTIPAANLPYSATAMSIAMEGEMDGANSTFVSWQEDADNLIGLTSGASNFSFTQEAATVVDTVTGGSYTSGLHVPFSIASRHAATVINGAVSGAALTANTTPTALPDLSDTNLLLGPTFMGTVRTFRMWGTDIGDAGIDEASA